MTSSPVRRRITLSMISALALGSVAVSPAASTSHPPPRLPFCGWWFLTTAQSFNVALPDTSAAYWTTPFVAEPGLRILVKGQFPDARFMSLTVYDNAGGTFTRNGVPSALVDYEVKPDRGTVSPFRVVTDRPGRFSITIKRRVAKAERNVIPMVPATRAEGIVPPGVGFIVYRIYLPQGGSFDSVPLPTVSLARHGRVKPLATCPWRASGGAVSDTRVASPPAPRVAATAAQASAPQFFRPKAETTNAFFPNVANAYLAATFTPARGSVVVVRGKAPSSSPGSTALPWPSPSYDMRYWSLCNNENVSPFPVVVVADPSTGGSIYGCSADLDTPLADGSYTYVLSSLADRPANATRANGITWMPYASRDVEQVLVFRNMLGQGFPSSVQNVPQDGDPASARSAMGDYYPRITTCSAGAFAAGGPSACSAER
jgi:hypothetical protein